MQRPADLPLLFLALLCLPAFAFSVGLLGYQLRLIQRGLTHIERCKRPQPTEFDLGTRANFRAVFGRGGACSFLAHLLPLPSKPVGDGLRFDCRPPAHRV